MVWGMIPKKGISQAPTKEVASLLLVTAYGDNVPPVDMKCPQAAFTCLADRASVVEGPLCPIPLLLVYACSLLGPMKQGGGQV